MLFDPTRRSALKNSGLALASAAATLLPGELSAQSKRVSTPQSAILDVRVHGATGDGKTIDSPAINRAIEAAASMGGGTVLFPAGIYLSFSIRLRSHVQLRLEPGATILAADSPLPGETTGYDGGTYDAAEPKTAWDAYQDYGHNHWHNSLIWGEGLENCSIVGPGLIWGKGLSNGRKSAHGRLGYRFVAEQPGVGNKSIALKNCRNVVLRDFAILKGGHFGLLLTGVDNLTIDNLTIDTDRDGMDIDCCRNVRVTNCVVNSPWDDGICPKSSFALGYARSTDNLMISNCYVTGTYQLGTVIDGSFKKFGLVTDPEMRPGYTGRIKCGTESNGGFRNITISNCVFEGCKGLALESVDGALLEDITISNITMRDVTSPLFLRLGGRLRGPDGTKVGELRRILINNLVSYNTASVVSSIVSGIPDHNIEDIKLSNIYIQHVGGASRESVDVHPPEFEKKYPEPNMFGPMPAQGFFFRHVSRLEVSHTEVQPVAPDPRPAFYLDDVSRADFIAVTAPKGGPAFSLHDVTDFRIAVSRAAPDMALEKIDDRTL